MGMLVVLFLKCLDILFFISFFIEASLIYRVVFISAV